MQYINILYATLLDVHYTEYTKLQESTYSRKVDIIDGISHRVSKYLVMLNLDCK